MERLSEKEMSPFLRTLDVWKERRIFSSHFIEKLQHDWSTHRNQRSEMRMSPHSSQPSNSKRLLVGDPSIVSVSSISERLSRQVSCSTIQAECIASVLPRTQHGFVSVEEALPRISNADCIRSFVVSLSAEINVRS